MPSTGSLHVGQVDPQTYFVYVTQAGALASFDFTTVTSASIRVKKPSGATQTWTGAISNQTTAGLTFTRTLQTGDLDEAGSYTGYLLMVVASGTLRSEAEEFFVAEEFAIVADEDTPSWFIAGAVISGGGGTVPTGTGVPHIVGGVQNAAASLIVNADVDAAAAIAVSKLAAGTNTYVLTTTAGVPVWAAPSGGGTVPTGTGFYTVTGGAMDAASAPYAAGVLSFLATPSSANLATMLTDETGTGENVFSTTPTFKTSVKLNNPGNTFAYTLTPTAIVANRTLNLPLLTGTDTLVGEAHTATLTNKSIDADTNTITNIENADIKAAAAIAVSKLAAGTNTHVLTTTGGVPVWAAPAAAAQPTGTGFYTVTGGAMDAASAPYAAGVLSFLATPSSANMRTMLTDESGTGEAIFSTTPTFKTSVKVNNPANTFAYTLTPAAIAADRTLTLPLLAGNDTAVCEAFTQTLTNKTINGSSNTITNVAISTAVSGLGANVATFLATPSSANLIAALTDETGTGENVFSTSPTFKTGILLNNPGNTFAYTFTPAAIAAARTITLPLLTSGDTMVTEAFTQTLTNKTINGSNNTITNVAISTAVSGLGANVATFLATPSSANLAAALTDETGTAGEVVFSTTPTFKTSVKVNNPANTFAYTLTPTAIAANRTLNLPLLTGTDTLVGEAHTQTLTNKTIAAGSNTITGIADTNVAVGAAILGTKISPDFGAQNVVTTGYYSTGGTVASAGNIRFGNTHKFAARNNANSADACLAQYGSGDVAYYGLNSAFGEQAYGWIGGASQYMYLSVASTYYIHLEASEVRMGNPVVGDDTVFACHGAVDSAMTDANYTVPASEYKYYTIKFACTGATTRTVTFPHPSSLASSYTKNIRGSTEKILTISTGTGTTVNLAVNKCRVFEFTNGGVRTVGPEYDP